MIHLTLAVWLVFQTGLKSDNCTNPDWGFWGHRKLNKMAVFTLPRDMLPLYKPSIDYLEEHAVDPDKRRYATPYEAIRHYIDLDQWGSLPFDSLPREWHKALAQYSKWGLLNESGDTTWLDFKKINEDTLLIEPSQSRISIKQYQHIFSRFVLPQYYNEEWICPVDTINPILGIELIGKNYIWKDHFSEHGILPYYLPIALDKLTRAFVEGNKEKILRFSAEIGHYIGDAHVPLHTTKNYNGQLTDQHGIHAFWESRLPELFADAEYDFFAGKAEYIKDPIPYFWDIIFESHRLLPEVLIGEKTLSQTFPKDNQFCYDERLGQTVRIQCREYARAYHDSMKGMVEQRMRDAIKSIGSVWYTAWVNAGQPDLNSLLEPSPTNAAIVEEPAQAKPLKNKIRDHEN
ncbi:MAG TPA: zinc dependent phospholipase C family protein [Saprospiraceae bacterium]|nr:zinc dependent phospholipase C family protein [Saprospiraceae bacterium]